MGIELCTGKNLSSVHHKYKLCRSGQNKQFIQDYFTEVFQFDQNQNLTTII